MKKNVYSVGQINKYISNMFAQDFLLQRISIKGEVSNCKYHSSGHIYFTLKDPHGAISAIMFAGNRTGLKFCMQDGDQVIVTGSVEVFERDGKYQIYARQIEKDGIGDLYLRFEALKQELEEMGMFAQEYKQPIPKYARTIGIVTAPTGAAIQDIRNIAGRRNPGVRLVLYPALVQGDGAAESIVSGIHALARLGVDVMIVGRGGGSIEDLWAFNEEIVARAIFDCPIPVISAVGHETDWTIADFAADLRAPTPSAAAELAVFDRKAVQEELRQKAFQAEHLMEQKLQMAKERLSGKQARLSALSPANRLNEKRHRCLVYQEKAESAMDRIFRQKRHRFELLAGKLDAVSPVRKLSGGYAFVEGPDQKRLLSAKMVKPKDKICVHVMDGKVRAEVTEVMLHE